MAKKRANGEGNIRKREDRKGWEARFYDENGHRHSVYGKTQAEVRKRLSEAVKESSESDDLEDDDLTVGQWLAIWQRDFLGNVKPGTVASYEMQVRVHILPILGEIKLTALRTPVVQRLYNQKLAQGLSPKSIKNIHGCLHRALDIAVQIGYLTKNPTSACILPKVHQVEIHPLDTPELKKLLNSIQGDENEALIITAIFTGMRSGELIGLTWDCVDFENGIIRVTKQLVQPRKKGASFAFGTPKNGKGRTLTPAPFVMEILKKHKKEQSIHRLQVGPAWDDGGFPNLVFTQPGGNHFCQWTVCRILQKKLEDAGIEKHRFHDLRHPDVKQATKNNEYLIEFLKIMRIDTLLQVHYSPFLPAKASWRVVSISIRLS